MKKKTILLYAFLLIAPFVGRTQSDAVMQARDFLKNHAASWGLDQSDLEDMLLSDTYITRHNGVRHVYFQQTVHGIPIYNGINSVHLSKEGKAYNIGQRFVAQAASRVNAIQTVLQPEDAVRKAAESMGINHPNVVKKEDQTDGEGSLYLFEGANMSQRDIEVKPVYFYQNGVLKLSWDLAIDDLRNPDFISVRVDATNGNILDTYNWTTYCDFDHDHKGCGAAHYEHRPQFTTSEVATNGSGAYRVFQLPAESPNHGSHDLVSNPHIPTSSPYGWHDISGDGSPDYTITRGNNVHAYPDLNNNNMSTGGEPDGGSGLVFDFPYLANEEPVNNLDAAVTNLFYMSNMMHDITYLFGFDEAAGNFQANNHGKGGNGGDYVQSEAQDGSGTNNANFSTPPDGSNGRMQMYVWTSGGEVFQVTAPSNISGGYETGEADFGPSILTDNVNVEAEIVFAYDDNPNNPTYVCDEVVNKEDVAGKIAIVDRGGCFFDAKVRNCEDAGAIAVLICNFSPSVIGMASSGTVVEPTIPALMLNSTDCATIKAYVGDGAVGRIKSPDQTLFPLDGDFDNGIIAHEFGHGVSNRLTAGPSQVGCLGNAEQMGEGWSDFFTLVTTVKQGDQGSTSRGIGTYAERQPTDGSGIRPRPYSTDFAVNELTYDHVKNEGEISQPHGIGTVWCTMLWDLYWAFVDLYGFDSDFSNASAGNNIAIQLVMDGMKMQPCNPGFVDGRDAILMADTMNYDGAHACMIWEVFARRGLGYYADQGNPDNRSDGQESFETAPLCQNKIRISKSAINIIEAGDNIEYTIAIANNKTEPSTDVRVTDIIADGCTYISGSASITPILTGNEIAFDLGELASLEQRVITYQVLSSSRGSGTLWKDDIESGEDNWDIDIAEGGTIWYSQDDFAHSGRWAFYTENEDNDADSWLFQYFPVKLDVDNPGLRFYHWYSTAAPTSGTDSGNKDGGVLEMSSDRNTWKFIDQSKMLRNGYTGALPYGTFVLPNLYGFYGDSKGFVDTYVDLDEYKGRDAYIRFRMGTEAGGLDQNVPDPVGWVVDDVEYIDMLFYTTDVCVTSAEGDNECARLPGKGTLVEPNYIVGAEDLTEDIEQLLVFPNPTHSYLGVKIDMLQAGTVDFNVRSIDGRLISQKEASLREGQQMVKIDVNAVPSGTYLIEMVTPMGSVSRKWIKE